MATRKKAAAETTALALKQLSEYRIANLDGKNVREIVEANTGGAISLADLTQVTIPAGGATSFEVANPIGEDETTKEIEGVLIFWNDRRSYWARGFDEADDDDDMTPDCFSADAKLGVGSPGGDCSTCPFAAWDSAREGRGQACKSQRLFFLLRQDSIMPLVIRAAPTSIQPSKKYLFGLASQMVPYWEIVSKITLETHKNGPIKYSTLSFTAGTLLTGDDRAMVAQYRNDLLPALEASTINPPARGATIEGEGPVDESDLADLSE